jgi:hypothetical protein
MKEIILKVLEELQDSQINIKSESAREILASKIEIELQTHISQIIDTEIELFNIGK